MIDQLKEIKLQASHAGLYRGYIMGIDVAAFTFLLENKDKVHGNVLQLGRQGMHVLWTKEEYDECGAIFKKFDSTTDYNQVYSTKPHADGLFYYMGAENVESMDYSPFEQASIIHDLNQPIPPELENKFDYIYDGGTIEHIFDIKTVMENVKKMLKTGGIFIGLGVGNGCVGHGFYQFSPELYRTVFSEEAGYKIHSLNLIINDQLKPVTQILPVPPKGERQELRIETSNPVYIAFVIEKLKADNNSGVFQQSDYIKNWEHFDNAVNNIAPTFVYRTS